MRLLNDMNRKIVDAVWKGWFKLPHCRINQYIHRYPMRKKFNYQENSDISIISVNCIGGELYSILGLQFLSPFINISMSRKEFIKMCYCFEDYINSKLVIIGKKNGGYVGELGSGQLDKVSIYFPHDTDSKKIVEDWERRKKRINYQKLVLICDDNGLDEDEIALFDQIKAYRKILFTTEKDYLDVFKCCYQLKKIKESKNDRKYQEKTLSGIWFFESIWDYVGFLNGENK